MTAAVTNWCAKRRDPGGVPYNLSRGMSGMMRGAVVASRKQKTNLCYHTVHPETLCLRVGAIQGIVTGMDAVWVFI